MAEPCSPTAPQRPGALQRLRAYVPRHAAATDASAAELRDARLIIARELGFPTWRELVSFTEKSRRELENARRSRRLRRRRSPAGRRHRPAGRLTASRRHLLQMLPTRGDPRCPARRGTRRAARRSGCADRQGTDLDLPLTGPPLQPGGVCAPAARRRRRPGTGRGAHPLENAIYQRHTQVVDLLADTGSSRRRSGPMPRAAGWILCGPVSMPDGRLRPDAASSRPNPADVADSRPGSRRQTIRRRSSRGVRPRLPARPDRGRALVPRPRRRPDVAPYLGRTACTGRSARHLEVIRLLLERGADRPSATSSQADADGWLHVSSPPLARSRDPATPRLIESVALNVGRPEHVNRASVHARMADRVIAIRAQDPFHLHAVTSSNPFSCNSHPFHYTSLKNHLSSPLIPYFPTNLPFPSQKKQPPQPPRPPTPTNPKPKRGKQKEGRPLGVGPLFAMCSGGVLLSHEASLAVPSALRGLTSGFGMGPGVSPSL